jgi:hypothetical protein
MARVWTSPEWARPDLPFFGPWFSGPNPAWNLRQFAGFCFHERAASTPNRKGHQIALDYLERTGEIADANEASRFLLRSLDQWSCRV